MTPKLSTLQRQTLIDRAVKGESISKICKEAGISRVIFYRWLKRYKNFGSRGVKPSKSGRPKGKESVLSTSRQFKRLSFRQKELLVKEVVDQNSAVSEVAKKYNVSRLTVYKWVERYLRSGNHVSSLENKVPYIIRYYRQTPEKYEQAVLSLVEQHPEYGVRSLVANLPKVGNTPIVGHHGVQKILFRNNLSTYEQRLAFVKSKHGKFFKIVNLVLSEAGTFFRLPFGFRQRVVNYSLVFFLSAFSTVVLAGLFSYTIRIAAEEGNIVTSLGLLFAATSLVAGSFFFLYSLKYYVTLAIVLSFSQKEGREDAVLPTKGFLASLFEKGGFSDVSRAKAFGLRPNLDHVRLKKHPFISVQIPFYNEKYVVERAIKASTNFDYPEYEVILCDDSTDETSTIITNYQKSCLFKGESLKVIKGDGWTLTSVEVKPGVTLKHLHRTTRTGFKGAALELARGLVNPKTEFISIFDADFVPYPDTLTLFLKYFKVNNNMSEDYIQNQVAAVQGYQWHVLNKSENWITRGVRSEYSGSYVIERSGTEIYGGLKQISGSVYMIRRDVLDELKWGTSITEDFELTLKLYNAGYKVLYTPYVQAPAECVSTVKRLIRQRMRWSEGHSQNIRKMFSPLILNPKLSLTEKLEFLYLSPYYLQAFFFLIGTISWLISETVFPAKLPFWTELWGWSLVLTNMIALPLLNSVGMFLEESEQKDYAGIGSFIALSYLVVPFQAYAALKGFLEKDEGTWFRTPKTGKITDIFSRGRFYKFISGFIPGLENTQHSQKATLPSAYLNFQTANSQFNSFNIKPKKAKWIGKLTLSFLLIISVTVYSGTKGVPEVLATSPTGNFYLYDEASSTLTGTTAEWKLVDNSADTTNSTTTTISVNNKLTAPYWFQYKPGTTNSTGTTSTGCTNNPPNNAGWFFDTPFQSEGSIASGNWTIYYNETDNRSANVGYVTVCVWRVTVSGGVINGYNLLFQASDSTDHWNAAINNTSYTSSQPQHTIGLNEYLYVEFWSSLTTIAAAGASANYTSTLRTGPTYSNPRIVTPTITIPENVLLLTLITPSIPFLVLWLKKKNEQKYLISR